MILDNLRRLMEYDGKVVEMNSTWNGRNLSFNGHL
jgi:hypothetical protein